MSIDPRLDRLHHILKRALYRSEITKQAKERLRKNSAGKSVSEDYADRLAEKYLYRQLLSDARLDALRFRWYFTHIKKDTPLEELRCWIDHKIIEEDTRHAKPSRSAPQMDSRP